MLEYLVDRWAAHVKHSSGFHPDQRMLESFGTRGGEILTRPPGELNADVNTLMRSMTATG